MGISRAWLVGTYLAVVAVVLGCVSTSTVFWLTTDLCLGQHNASLTGHMDRNVSTNLGLFKQCVMTTCLQYPEASSVTDQAIREIVRTGAVASVVMGTASALFVFLVTVFSKYHKASKPLFYMPLVGSALACALAGVAVGLFGTRYGTFLDPSLCHAETEFDYSFYICIASSVVYVPCAVCFLLGVSEMSAHSNDGELDGVIDEDQFNDFGEGETDDVNIQQFPSIIDLNDDAVWSVSIDGRFTVDDGS